MNAWGGIPEGPGAMGDAVTFVVRESVDPDGVTEAILANMTRMQVGTSGDQFHLGFILLMAVPRPWVEYVEEAAMRAGITIDRHDNEDEVRAERDKLRSQLDTLRRRIAWLYGETSGPPPLD